MGDQLQPRTPIQGGSVSQLKGALRQARLGDRPPQHFMARPDVQSLKSVEKRASALRAGRTRLKGIFQSNRRSADARYPGEAGRRIRLDRQKRGDFPDGYLTKSSAVQTVKEKGGRSYSRLTSLDRFQVQRTGLAVAVASNLIGETLAGLRGSNLAVPRHCASLETEVVAARLRLDGASAPVDVKRADGAKEFHDEFLCFQAPKAAPVG